METDSHVHPWDLLNRNLIAISGFTGKKIGDSVWKAARESSSGNHIVSEESVPGRAPMLKAGCRGIVLEKHRCCCLDYLYSLDCLSLWPTETRLLKSLCPVEWGPSEQEWWPCVQGVAVECQGSHVDSISHWLPWKRMGGATGELDTNDRNITHCYHQQTTATRKPSGDLNLGLKYKSVHFQNNVPKQKYKDRKRTVTQTNLSQAQGWYIFKSSRCLKSLKENYSGSQSAEPLLNAVLIEYITHSSRKAGHREP